MIKLHILFFSFLFWQMPIQAQTWVQKANVGGPGREYAVAFSIGNKGYIATGYDGFDGRDDLWEYDPATDTWTQKASVPIGGMDYAIGFSIGNKGYICSGGGTTDDFWEWDQASDTWTQRAHFPGGWRALAIAFSIGNKGYMGLGNNMTGDAHDLWEWDGDTASPTFDTWTQKANFIGGSGTRREAVCFSIGTKGYVATGSAPLLGYRELWEFEGDTNSPNYNTWTQKANFGGTGRYSAAGFAIGTKAYVGTGDDGGSTGIRDDFWEWDQPSNTWTQKPNFAGGARYIAVGLAIGNKGYIGTGNNYGPSYLNDFWEYCDTCSIVTNAKNYSVKDIQFYPNPASDKIYLFNVLPDNGFIVTFCNVAGQKIKIVESVNNVIDVADIEEGMYFLQIETKEGTFTKKLMIRR